MIWPPPDDDLLLEAVIPGAAVQAGSKRGTVARYKNEQKKWRISTWFDSQGHQHAKVNVSDVKDKELKKRAKVIEEHVVAAIADQGFFMPGPDVPLAVEVVFYRQRGKGHYRSGKFSRILKPDAPAFPATPPDTTKLWRGTEDALTELTWHDDSRVIRQLIYEDFVHLWEEPRTELKMWRLPETVSDLPREKREELTAETDDDQATLLSS